MLFSLFLIVANGFQIRDDSCRTSDAFTKQSFELAFYPPDASGFSQPVLYGVFNQDTYVDHVVGSWSDDNEDWNDFAQPINLTYPATMQVMFAPWIRFSSLPDSNENYYGRIGIYGQNNSELIWCSPFEIPYIPN